MKSIFVLFLVLQLIGCAAVKHRDQIGVLLDYGNNQEGQEKAVNSETKIFNRAKEAILEGKLLVGMDQETVEKKIGNPVIVETLESGSKWSYKAGSSNWMNGEIVRVYFDEAKQLKKWECKNFECS